MTEAENQAALAEQLAIQLRNTLHGYVGKLPLATAVGVLRVVEWELIYDHKEDAE